MKAGTRVTVNDKSPWRERVGAEGVVVDLRPDSHLKPTPGYSYVLLDDDPAPAASPHDVEARGWSDAWPDDALDPA